MANQKEKIIFDIGFNMDKNSVNNIKSSLEEMKKSMSMDMFAAKNPTKTLDEVRERVTQIVGTADSVQDALDKAFNPRLGTVNIEKFWQELKKVDVTAEVIEKDFSEVDYAGQKAFRNMAVGVMTANKDFQKATTILDKMGTTLMNTARWAISSSVFNNISGSFQEMYGYIKNLDNSLNDIRIVTGKSADEMERFAVQANNAAKQLGITTTGYTKASLTFYQQGLSDEEVRARTELTTKVANASGLNADAAAEYVTAVLNGYKVGSEEAERAMDVLANVGAHTASSLSELSEAMSKVSSTANTMGVSEEQLAASLATVIQTTRQDAASVGTAFKTIFMRISDIKAGTEDAEVSLGEYTSQMAQMGINVLDQTGKLRDLGDVIEEIGNGWSNMSREQQVSLARSMAGTRQANQLLALFDNWEEYGKALGYATEATGTLQRQNEIYLESTEAHLNQLKAAKEDLFDSLLDADSINSVSDALTEALEFLANFVDALGGGKETLQALGSLAMVVFSKQIGNSLGSVLNNFKTTKTVLTDIETQLKNTKEFANSSDSTIKDIAQNKLSMRSYSKYMKPEDEEHFNEILKERAQYLEEIQRIESNKASSKNFLKNKEQMNLFKENEQYQTINFSNITGANAADENLLEFQNQLRYINEDIDNAVGGYQEFLSLLKETDEASKSTQTFREQLKYSEQYVKETGPKRLQESKESKTGKPLEDSQKDIKRNIEQANDTINNFTKQDQENLNKFNQYQENFRDAMDNQYGIAESLKSVLNKEDIAVLETAEKEYNEVLSKNELTSKEGIEAAKKYTSIINELAKKTQPGVRALAKTIEDGMNDAERAAKTGVERTSRAIENLKKSFTNPALVSSISSLAGGMMQIGSVMNTLRSLASTWEDETLSSSEKITQTLQGVGSVLLMVIAAGKSLIDVFSKASLAAWKAAGPWGLAIGAILAVVVAVTKAIVKMYNADADAAKEAQERADRTKKAFTEAQEAAKNLKNEISDYSKAIKSLEDLDTTTEEYKNTLEETNEKARELINNYNLLKGVDYTVVDGQIQIFEKVLKSIQEEKEKAASVAEALTYSTNISAAKAKNTSLYTETRRTLGGSVDNSTLEKAVNAINQLSEISNKNVQQALQDQKILTTTNDNTITALIKLANNIKHNDEQIQANTDALYATSIKHQFSDDIIKRSTDKNGNIDYQKAASLEAAFENYTTNSNKEIYKNAQKEAENNTKNFKFFESSQEGEIFDGLLKYTDEAEKIFQQYGITYNPDNNELNAESIVKAYAKIYGATDSELNGAKYEDGVLKIKDPTTGEYKEKYKDISTEEMMNTIIQSYYDNQAQNKVIEQTDEGNQAALIQLDKLQSSENPLEQIFFKMIESGSDNIDLSSLDPQAIKNLQSKVAQMLQIIKESPNTNFTDDMIFEALGLDIDSVQLTQLGFKTGEDFLQGLSNATSNYDSNEFFNNIISEATTAVTSVQDKISKGELTAINIEEDTDYQNLIGQVEQLVSIYPELTDTAEILNSTWLVGTEEYSQALSEVQTKINDLKVVNLTNKANQLVADFKKDFLRQPALTVDLDDEEFKRKLNEILNIKKEIILQISSNIDSETDKITSAIEKLQTNSELIGENFIVAAKDVKELGNTFPGILDQATIMADGTVKLNEDIAKSAIGTAQKEIESSSQSSINNIKNQKIELQNQKTKYQNLLTMVEHAAKGEFDIENSKSKTLAAIADKLADDQAQANAESVDAQSENDQELVKASIANGQAYGANWTSAHRVKVSASAESTKIAINNDNTSKKGSGPVQGVADFHPITFGSGSLGTTTQGKTTTTRRIIDNSGTEKNSNVLSMSEANFLSDEKKFITDMIDLLDASINNSDSSLTELKANQQKLIYGLTNIGKSGSDSGSGSGSQKNEKELLEAEKDLYYEIENELKKISVQYDKLVKKQKLLIGKDLLDNLKEQNALLEKQNDLYKTKRDIALKEQEDLQKSLKKQNVEFDQDNNLLNYSEVLNKKRAEINKLIEKYNKSNSEQLEKQIENAQKAYDELKADMERYNTVIVEVIPELDNQLVDNVIKQLETQLSQAKIKIELGIEIRDIKKSYQEFEKRFIREITDNSELTKRAREIALQAQNSYSASNPAWSLAMDKILELSAVYESINDPNRRGKDTLYYNAALQQIDIEQLKKDTKDYLSSMTSDITAAHDAADQLKNLYLESIDNENQMYQAAVKSLNNYSTFLSHNLKMAELLYGDKAYDKMQEYYNAQTILNQNLVETSTKELQYIQDQMKKAKSENNKEAYDKYKAQWETVINEINGYMENSVEQITQRYANTVNVIFQKLDDELSNFKGFDLLEEELDLIEKTKDLYLDKVNTAYAIQNLRNKWQDAINETDSLTSQRRLNKAMQTQMAILEKKDQLTQYEVDRAEKLYEITLKQIALEEAQQNKTNMRLMRDSQGNYSYQFVADEEEINKAKQELLAAQNELYNMDKEEYERTVQSSLENWKTWQEKIKEIANDQNLTDEQQKERIEMLNKNYALIFKELASSNKMAQEKLKESVAAINPDFLNKSIEEQNAYLSSLSSYWDSGSQKMIDKLGSAGENFYDIIEEPLNKILKENEQARKEINNVEQQNLEIQQQISQNLRDISIEAFDALDGAKDAVASIYQSYDMIQNVLKAIHDCIDWTDELIKKFTNFLTGAIDSVGNNDPSLMNAKGTRNRNTTSAANKRNQTRVSSVSDKQVSTGVSSIDNLNLDSSIADIIVQETINLLNDKNKVVDISSTNMGKRENIVQQQVNITAHFEGQTEASEIQTALDNLVNIAAQRAFRLS